MMFRYNYLGAVSMFLIACGSVAPASDESGTSTAPMLPAGAQPADESDDEKRVAAPSASAGPSADAPSSSEHPPTLDDEFEQFFAGMSANGGDSFAANRAGLEAAFRSLPADQRGEWLECSRREDAVNQIFQRVFARSFTALSNDTSDRELLEAEYAQVRAKDAEIEQDKKEHAERDMLTVRQDYGARIAQSQEAVAGDAIWRWNGHELISIASVNTSPTADTVAWFRHMLTASTRARPPVFSFFFRDHEKTTRVREYNEALARTLYYARSRNATGDEDEVLKHVLRSYEQKNPIFLLDECKTTRLGACTVSRKVRVQFERAVVDSMLKQRESGLKPLTYVNFGSGKLLQDVIIVSSAIEKGLTDINVMLIDPIYSEIVNSSREVKDVFNTHAIVQQFKRWFAIAYPQAHVRTFFFGDVAQYIELGKAQPDLRGDIFVGSDLGDGVDAHFKRVSLQDVLKPSGERLYLMKGDDVKVHLYGGLNHLFRQEDNFCALLRTLPVNRDIDPSVETKSDGPLTDPTRKDVVVGYNGADITRDMIEAGPVSPCSVQ